MNVIRQKLYGVIATSDRQQAIGVLNDGKNLGMNMSDIPEDVFLDLERALGNSSDLFSATEKSQRTVPRNSRHYDEQILFDRYRSALELLSEGTYARVYRAFFFSRFDFSPKQIRKLFLGLLSGTPWSMWKSHYDGSLISAPSVLNDLWERFEGIVEQAVEEGYLQVDIIDIEAAFLSVPFDFFIHEGTKANPLDRAFATLTDGFVNKRKAVELYRSPYLRLSRTNPYRDKILFNLTKEDLSDKDLILKWWKDVDSVSSREEGLEQSVNEAGTNGYFILRSFIQSSVDAAKKTEDFEKAFNEDPFILELFRAVKDDKPFGQVVDEISSTVI